MAGVMHAEPRRRKLQGCRPDIQVKWIVADVHAENLADANRFYGDVLGLDVLMDLGWVPTYGSSESMKVQITFASEGVSGSERPDLSIEVDDLGEALARFGALGFKVEYGPVDEPWGVRRFNFRDPFGKLVNILQHIEMPEA